MPSATLLRRHFRHCSDADAAIDFAAADAADTARSMLLALFASAASHITPPMLPAALMLPLNAAPLPRFTLMPPMP
jgi:hypothetical protein